MKATESHRRSIIKALSWRALAVTITMSVTYAVTGQLELAAAVGLVDTIIKLGVYYAHERVWNRVNFGLGTAELAARERSENT